jgi:hypothetical protein
LKRAKLPNSGTSGNRCWKTLSTKTGYFEITLNLNNFTKKGFTMTTILINEKTKIGKNILEMLKALSRVEDDNSIRILDEAEFLLSTKANKEALMHGISQVKEGEKGKTIKPSELWK